MAKPDITLSRFANLGGSNVLVPSSGLRDSGIEDDTPAEPGYINELFAQAYAWALYIDAGILEGPITIDDDLTVEGDVIAEQDVVVTGNVEVTGNIEAITTFATIKGYNVHHTGERTLRINSASARADQAVAAPAFNIGADTGDWEVGTTTGQVQYPIPIRSGDRIKSWKIFIGKYSATGTITARMYKKGTGAGAPTAVGAAVTNAAASPGETSLVQTGLDHATLDDFSYYVVINGGGITGDLFRDLHVNVTNPG